jgi:hypothetical protein
VAAGSINRKTTTFGVTCVDDSGGAFTSKADSAPSSGRDRLRKHR